MTGESSDINPPQVVSLTHRSPWKFYGIAVGIVTIATFLNFLLSPFLAASNLIMVYLLGVTIVALFGRIGPSVLASILSVLAYDFFFIPPFYSFEVSDIEYVFTLIVMLIVTQLISHLTIITRRQAESARLTQHQTSALYTLSRQLSSTRGINQLLDIGTEYIGNNFDSKVLALLPVNSHLEVRGSNKSIQMLDTKDQGVAQWVYELGQKAGFGTDTLSFSNSLYIPLLATKGPIGVLRIHPKKHLLFTPEQVRLIEACASQLALALEVDRLQDKNKQKELKSAIDTVHSTLLQSISHDLRIPLISIIAKASSMMEIGDTLDGNDIKKIGMDIYYETDQLSRLINNLLQITYLETNDIKLQIKPNSLLDVIKHVVKISSKKLSDRPVHINVPVNLPLIPFDSTLIQEVIINLIDNAVKFTPHDSPIDIVAAVDNEKVIVSIEDRGPGIMPDEEKKLFEKFYRGRMLTTERGLGLGLAICRAIIEAHHGKIWPENRNGGGVAFHFTLPLTS